MSIQPETVAWLCQTATADGAIYSQVLLDLLERLEALEADATDQSQSSSFCNEAIVRRLEALEQWLTRGDFVQVPPIPEAAPVATDNGLLRCYAEAVEDALKRGDSHDEATKAGRRAIFNLGRQHGGDQPVPSTEFAADTVIVHCPETCWVEVRRAADGKVLYDNFRRGSLVIPVGEPPAAHPAPAGGLVHRLACELAKEMTNRRVGPGFECTPIALAAIREVAAWLDRYGCRGCSLWLREEVTR